MAKLQLFTPDWPAPNKIKAFATGRQGGLSQSAFAGLNLAKHVGDNLETVEQNRSLLQASSGHPNKPCWLQQTHSTRVVEYSNNNFGTEADGCFTIRSQQPCVVMTADCLPILLCSKDASFVAAVHAGWRGLADGILFEALKKYSDAGKLMAWVGPAISADCFEVGEDVLQAFLNNKTASAEFFQRKSGGKYLCNLTGIAEQQLTNQGVTVYQSSLCSFKQTDDFYSYRRDGETGRMASMIWIDG